MIDFTLKTYQKLLKDLRDKGYHFLPVEQHASQPREKLVILRHDVDRLPQNSLVMAALEHELGIHGTYYFRIVAGSLEGRIIRKIAELGHEIGYHYEDLETAGGQTDKAYDLFCRNLEKFRKLYPVKTICMHGSPLSRWNNRDLWRNYDYRKLGVTCEPYLDIDFTQVLYLSDTGRRWDGSMVSVRDKVQGLGMGRQTSDIRTTFDIIRAAQKGQLPDQIMITVHPQRWTNHPMLWAQELLVQNVKNVVKFFIVRENRGNQTASGREG